MNIPFEEEEFVPGPNDVLPPPFLEPTISELRQQSYALESDPIFFKWQRGEATEQEWLDVIQAIRDRFPHPEK